MPSFTRLTYLGPEASFSHQAAIKYHGRDSSEIVSCSSIENVFESIITGPTAETNSLSTCGIVPFENSTNGFVDLTLDQLADHAGSYSALTIVDEIYVQVQHSLLGPSYLPKQSPTVVYSHPQVFGQCKTYLKECLPRVQLREVGSTAEAARIVGGSDDVGIAAIASPYAAELYGCAVLEKHIEDDRENRTRFLVLGRKDDVSREGEHGGLGAEVEGGARVKSLVSFMLYHEKPGALADVLGVFRDAGMNLTSISSRPCRMHQWEYRFFVEVAGRVEVGSDVWEGLGRTATAIRCWGSWRASSL